MLKARRKAGTGGKFVVSERSGVSFLRRGPNRKFLFDGFQVLHWSHATDGNGVVFAGDQLEVCMVRNWVTFMYSYASNIPLNRAAVESIVAALNLYPFERLHAAFPGRFLARNAREIAIPSAERFISAISTSIDPKGTEYDSTVP